GLMITGSHNPPDQNGFKIVCGSSTIFGSDIQEIRQILSKGEFVTGSGKISRSDIKERYITAVMERIHHPINLRVVIDSGNGMAGLVAKDLYTRLGCDVVDLYPEPDGRFPNH